MEELKFKFNSNSLNRNCRVYSSEVLKKAMEEFINKNPKDKIPINDDKGNAYIACNPRIIINKDSPESQILSVSLIADTEIIPKSYIY